MNGPRRWWIEAGDTWFFRESRPHGAAGASELSSLFPPPARTVAGAIRTLIGDTCGVDWKQFAKGRATSRDGRDLDLTAEIGDPSSFGKLQLDGPFLAKDGQLLYAAPAALISRGRDLLRLAPGLGARCDLGRIRLPVPIGVGRGEHLQPVESSYVDAAGMNAFLAGSLPTTLVHESQLLVREARLGIARDNMARTAEDGLLYQTRHLRPSRPDMSAGDVLTVVVDVGGIDQKLQPRDAVVRLGGEGRPAYIRVEERPESSEVLSLGGVEVQDAPGLVLVLMTHADFTSEADDCSWLPPGFIRSQQGDETVWRGQLAGVDLTIHSACVGRPVREGGWDMVNRSPRPLASLVPAGTTYFCTTTSPIPEAVEALHGLQIGRDTAIGRGRCALGLWRE